MTSSVSSSAIHRVLGPAFEVLPPEVRAAHDHAGTLVLSGLADVETGPGLLRRAICTLTGLPRAGSGQPVSVSLETDAAGVDRWQRNFAGRRYSSSLEAGHGRRAGRLVERMGPMTNVFSLQATPEGLVFHLEGFAMMGLFLPKRLSPRCHAIETGEQGSFKFDITIDLPVIGRLMVYRGIIHAPEPQA